MTSYFSIKSIFAVFSFSFHDICGIALLQTDIHTFLYDSTTLVLQTADLYIFARRMCTKKFLLRNSDVTL